MFNRYFWVNEKKRQEKILGWSFRLFIYLRIECQKDAKHCLSKYHEWFDELVEIG